MRALRAIAVLLGAAVVVLLVVLVEAHVEIRGLDPPLPSAEALAEMGRARSDGPVSIRWVDTSTQPTPDGRAMAHPGFLLEWRDGRVFLIDAGMDREGALDFGAALEWVGNGKAVAHGSVGEQLGAEAARIAGVGFTHLHHDHTGGMAELCEAAGHPLTVFQTPYQYARLNYGTSLGMDALAAADCARRERLGEAEGEASYVVPGFPGLHAIPAAGHTPGSTIWVARVGDTRWILSGDVTNSKPNLLSDTPKPLAYSLVVVPEHRERLGRLRRWLAALDADPTTVVLPSHDGTAIQEVLGPGPGLTD